MNIRQATRRHESWLRQQTHVVERDLRLKHPRMAESPFTFLRATYYRWAQIWPEICPKLADAPRVLAVGAPCRVKRPLTESEVASLQESSDRYVDLAREHRVLK